MGYVTPSYVAIPIMCGSSTPLASNSYYGGCLTNAMTSTANIRRVYFPTTGSIIEVVMEWFCTVGSADATTVALRLNNATDFALSTTLDFSVSTQFLQKTGLNIQVTPSDYFEIKLTTPAWASPPTTVYMGGYVLIRVG